MSCAVHTTLLRINANHPALAGHFPGRPIVPGVVLLDCVLQHAERWLQHPLRVVALPHAKFIAPLPPDEPAQLQLQLDGQELRFTLSRDGVVIARGLFRIASPDGTGHDGDRAA